MNNLLQEKVQQAIGILNEKSIDMWLTFVRESDTIHDPSLDLIAGTGVTWESAFIICKNEDAVAIVGNLDVINTKEKTPFKEVIGYVKSIQEPLIKTIGKHNPQKIAINFSKNSSMSDGLTHGMYLQLCSYLQDTQFASRFVTAEDIISALRGRKTETEIEYMREAARITLEIFDQVTQFVKPGITEKQVADFILDQVKQRGLTTAWSKEHCPAVFSGPDTAGAHASPTERIIQKGHLINIDFGVKYNDYCSDLQRTWYVLRDGEDAPPAEVMKGFNTIVGSVQKAADAIKPGLHGVEIDDIARKTIIAAGYEEYPHALGHQIGRIAHDGGGLLAPRWQKYGNLPFLPIEKSQVYTIEPRLNVEGFGIATIEEEVIVKDDGVEFISKPQKEIILIKE